MSPEDDALIGNLRSDAVGGLRPFILDDLPYAHEGIILVFCGDGHRSPEAVRYMLSQLSCFGENTSLHKIADNGQPLLLHPSIINDRKGRAGSGLHLHFLESIRDAYTLGKGRTVLLLGHWPCGLAVHCELSLPKYLQAICETKGFVRDNINNDIIEMNQDPERTEKVPLREITIITGLHAHRPTGMKTYFVSRKETLHFLR